MRHGALHGSEEVDERLLQEAADWFLRVRSAELDSDIHTSWLAWIEAQPQRRVAFEVVQRAWDATGGLDALHDNAQEEIAQLTGTRRRKAWVAGFALAACAALVAIIVFVGGVGPLSISFPGRADWYERIATGRAESQTAVLSDGSRVELGGLTGIEVFFTPERRLVVAEEGDTFYHVRRDPKRPFVVQAGPVRVTAIGTAFAIRREGGSVSVLVTEGTVEITPDREPAAHDAKSAAHTSRPVRAVAGERVRFDRGEHSLVVQHQPDSTWRKGQQRFEQEPLRLVVASLNRYSARRIVIADPALEDLQFTGIVNNDGVGDWLQAVQVIFPVRVTEREKDFVLLEARR